MTAASRMDGHWLRGAQGEVASAVRGDATLIATPTLSAPGRDPKHPGATHLELVRFSGSNQLGDEKVCVKKVHVLIQEAVQDEQAVGPGRQGGVRVEGGTLLSCPEAVSPSTLLQPRGRGQK